MMISATIYYGFALSAVTLPRWLQGTFLISPYKQRIREKHNPSHFYRWGNGGLGQLLSRTGQSWTDLKTYFPVMQCTKPPGTKCGWWKGKHSVRVNWLLKHLCSFVVPVWLYQKLFVVYSLPLYSDEIQTCRWLQPIHGAERDRWVSCSTPSYQYKKYWNVNFLRAAAGHSESLCEPHSQIHFFTCHVLWRELLCINGWWRLYPNKHIRSWTCII